MAAERALRWAAALAAAEAVVLLAVVVARGDRATLAVGTALALKLLFCRGVVRSSAGSFLALLLYEAATLLFAAGAPGVATALRVLAGTSALTVLMLLGRSARLFPSPQVPRP